MAFLSPGAFERLPLMPGSILVVNCNEATAKACQTDPREVKKYLAHGVKVYNVSNLHAKVLVLGSRAFIGSANVSKSSEGLLEAAIVTAERTLVKSCKEFVQSLAGEELTPKEVERLIPLFDPKRFNRRMAQMPKGGSGRKTVPQHNPLWAIRTISGSWDEIDFDVERNSKPQAEKKITSEDFKLTDFRWPCDNSAFANQVRAGDVVLQIHEDGRRPVLQPPQKVVMVKRYRKGRRLMIFVQQRKWLRDRKMAEVRSSLPKVANFLSEIGFSRMIRDPQIVHDVQNLWSREQPLRAF